MRVVDAVYINSGGGKVLLQLLVDQPKSRDLIFWLDERIRLERMPSNYVYVASGERAREKMYLNSGDKLKSVLCFGNVPPPVRTSCPAYVYFHGPVILDCNLPELPTVQKIKFMLKRAYIAWKRGHAALFAVQTPLMADLLSARIGVPFRRIELVPFWQPGRFGGLASVPKVRDAFGYVSLPYPHKNHGELLAAWELLAARGVYPELHLTVPPDASQEILSKIERSVALGLKIVNHGFCDPSSIYGRCEWQIFPSKRESFGLGLIEAVESGCRIVAPDSPYVHAVVVPSRTWNPAAGPEAIADAVQACLTTPSVPSRLSVENRLTEVLNLLYR